MEVRKAFDYFIQDKMTYCAAATIIYYKENISRFIDYINIEETEDITRDIYISYISYLRSSGRLSDTSVRTYTRAVRSFLNWLNDNGYVKTNITKNVHLPKDDAADQYPLTSKEVDEIDSMFGLNIVGIRNYLIFHLMLDCGLRRGDVIRLHASDVSPGSLSLKHCKVSKSRIIPLPENLFFAAEKIKEFNRKKGDNVFLFYSFRKMHQQITEYTIKMLFQKLKTKCPRVHAHLLRHTFATSFMIYNGNIEILRLILGHSDYTITQRYLHLSSQMLLIKYDIYKIDDCFLKR